jgi:nucleotide-binding universal stress UspA family protein
MTEPMTKAANLEQRSAEPSRAPFHRLLVAVDGTDAAAAADAVATEWAQSFGGEVRRMEMAGARNDAVVHDIADAASAFGADVIVLGCDRRRLSRHRLAHSLRERLARATDVPVLVAPVDAPAAPSGQGQPGQPEADHDQRIVFAMRRSAHV